MPLNTGMTHPFNLSAVLARHGQRTGIFSGFITASDLTRFSQVVRVDGLCRDRLGHDRFCAVFTVLQQAAARLASGRFRSEALHAEGKRIGYEFRFEDAEIARRFKIGHVDSVRDLILGDPA
jgi:hypothetical protein